MQPTNRRDLLKFFGVGASIVPIIGGAPVIEAQAKLLEQPNIELLNDYEVERKPPLATVRTFDGIYPFALDKLAENLFFRYKGVANKLNNKVLIVRGKDDHSHALIGTRPSQQMLDPSFYEASRDLPLPVYTWTVSEAHWIKIG